MNSMRNRRMGFETLENKRLLAGDVLVSVSDGGTLLIRGDMESNGVAITSGDAPGEFVIAGLPSDDGVATSINGTFDRVALSGVSQGINMRMGMGDDGVRLFGARIRGNVNIATGDGADHVSVGGPVDSPESMNTVISGGLNVATGEGDDGVRIGRTGVARGLSVASGEGDDSVSVVDSRLRGVTSIHTDGGDDGVNIEGTLARFVRMGTGAGADNVALTNSVFSAIGYQGGEGDDSVVLNRVRARGAWFQGGPGEDSLQFDGPTRFGVLGIRGFESISGGDEVTADDRLDDVFAEVGSVDHAF